MLAGLVLPSPPPAALAAATALFTALSFATLGAPARPDRRSKLLTRFAPAALGGATLSGGLGAHRVAGACCALVAIAAALVTARAYRRRGPDRSPCAACPDRTGPRICPGFLPMARREAAFRRLAGRWIRQAR